MKPKRYPYSGKKKSLNSVDKDEIIEISARLFSIAKWSINKVDQDGIIDICAQLFSIANR